MVAGRRHSVCAELEEQRCIIEGQHVEILRQQHHIEMQRRRIDYVENELAILKETMRRFAPIHPRTQRSRNHRAANGDGNGDGHHITFHRSNDTGSSAETK